MPRVSGLGQQRVTSRFSIEMVTAPDQEVCGDSLVCRQDPTRHMMIDRADRWHACSKGARGQLQVCWAPILRADVLCKSCVLDLDSRTGQDLAREW
eukprot:3829364-Pyramimonas_sp.AAC.2